MAFRQRVGEVRVDLQREQIQRIETLRIDNRHIVGGTNGWASKVSACAPANIQCATFNHVSNWCQQPALAALFQQLESITAADNHDLSIFNRGNGIDNAMNTGDRNTQRSENRSRFLCVIIPGLRYASERDKHR
eukprot:284401_1